MADGWPAWVEDTYACACGQELGLSPWPARWEGDDLGPTYLRLDDRLPSGCASLWRIGSARAGAYDQRCPGCGCVLPMPERQHAEQLGLL